MRAALPEFTVRHFLARFDSLADDKVEPPGRVSQHMSSSVGLWLGRAWMMGGLHQTEPKVDPAGRTP